MIEPDEATGGDWPSYGKVIADVMDPRIDDRS